MILRLHLSVRLQTIGMKMMNNFLLLGVGEHTIAAGFVCVLSAGVLSTYSERVIYSCHILAPVG